MASAAQCKCWDRLGNALVCGAGIMQGAAKRGAQRGAGVLSGVFKGAGARGTGQGAPHPRVQGQAAEDHHCGGSRKASLEQQTKAPARAQVGWIEGSDGGGQGRAVKLQEKEWVRCQGWLSGRCASPVGGGGMGVVTWANTAAVGKGLLTGLSKRLHLTLSLLRTTAEGLQAG